MLVGFGLSRLGLIDVELTGEGIRVLAELALVLVLFTDAARIDLACLRREESLPLRLLLAGLPLTILCGALVAAVTFPALDVLEALLLASILAPTDAALGQAVVSSRQIPVRIRQSLNVESGLNDGIVLPVVVVTASLVGALESTGGVSEWGRFVGVAARVGPAGRDRCRSGWGAAYRRSRAPELDQRSLRAPVGVRSCGSRVRRRRARGW